MGSSSQVLVDGKLVATRLIRSDDIFPIDVSPPVVEKMAQIGDWEVAFRAGPILDEVARVVAIYDVGRSFYLNYAFGLMSDGSASFEESMAARDTKISEAVDAYSLPEDWRRPERLYSTITVSRNIKVDMSRCMPTYHYWLPEDYSVELLKKYMTPVEEMVGLAVAKMLLAPPFRMTGPVYGGTPRFMVSVPDRQPSPPIRIQMNATPTVERATWKDVEESLRARPIGFDADVSSRNTKAISRIGQWNLNAYNEDDPFRRFLWSYAGLEGVVDAIANSGRGAMTKSLSERSGLGEGVISELLWPPDVRESDPNRSLRFRFALTAALLSPETADSDVDIFIELNRYRNGVHGRLVLDATVPAPEAFNLFERYSVLAVTFLSHED